MKKDTKNTQKVPKASPQAAPKGGGGKLSTRGKVIIGGVVVAVVGAVVYLMKDKIFKTEAPLPAGTPAAAAGTSTPKSGAAPAAQNETLAMGSKGANVIRLQNFLNEYYYKWAGFAVVKEPANPMLETKTGIFGAKTEAALEKQYKKKVITIAELDAWMQTVKQEGTLKNRYEL